MRAGGALVAFAAACVAATAHGAEPSSNDAIIKAALFSNLQINANEELAKLEVSGEVDVSGLTTFLQNLGVAVGDLTDILLSKVLQLRAELLRRAEEERKELASAFADIEFKTDWVSLLVEAEIALLNGFKPDNSTEPDEDPEPPVEPATVGLDWRVAGVVNSVVNQGRCGSCWAVAGADVMASRHAIEAEALHQVSAQELVSCDKDNGGCNGGHYARLWAGLSGYAAKTAVESTVTYPYSSGNGQQPQCDKEDDAGVVSANRLVRLTSASDNQLTTALESGPVAVAISASCPGFQQYKSGILSAAACTARCDSPRIDHAVVLVGYGETEAGAKFWLVRNSWGPSWGEDGYVRIERDENSASPGLDAKGPCGINQDAAFPAKTTTAARCGGDATCGDASASVTVGDPRVGTSAAAPRAGGAPAALLAAAAALLWAGVAP